MDLNEFARMFRALSNQNRLSIFLHLVSCCCPGTTYSLKGARTCVGELGKELEIVPSTVSHHIKELNRAGLIHMERRGKNVDCWVEPETMEKLARFFSVHLNNVSSCDASEEECDCS
ncbi:ArsR/SmtB family transcription factor [Candidatus Riflebacteria bacterium]